MVTLKRIYEKPHPDDGYRILVDRLWPRGISKKDAAIDSWFKDIAPSDELRKWFNHDPKKWEDFKDKYMVELKNNPKLTDLQSLISQHSKVTLLYGAKDEKHNNAVIVQAILLCW